MAKIESKRVREAAQRRIDAVVADAQHQLEEGARRIRDSEKQIEPTAADLEEILKRTTRGVPNIHGVPDINYIQHEDF